MISPVVLHGCPRCDGPLDLYDRFARCVVCGWQDYGQREASSETTQPGSSRSADAGASAGGAYPDRIFYRGDGRRFGFDDTLEARVGDAWRDTVLVCPYDGGVMRHVGRAGAHTPFVQVYTCRRKRHRVRLWRQTNGDLAWR